MKALAWDTSSRSGAIAAFEWTAGRDTLVVRSEWSLSVAATHSEQLLWGIDQVLKAAGWKKEELDLFGVGVGPGSFTGLRIGITTARTLAHTLQKPVIPLSSLSALVRPAAEAAQSFGSNVLVLGVSDAAKGEWFTLGGLAKSVVDCVCKADGDQAGLWKSGVWEEVQSPDAFISQVKKRLSQGGSRLKWMAVGESVDRYADVLKKLPKARRLEWRDPCRNQVQARYLALLTWQAAQAGIQRDALSIVPRYLRDSDAEVKLKQGLLKPSPRAVSFSS